MEAGSALSRRGSDAGISCAPKDAEGLKPSLALARQLREAGYVAEFDLGYRETADFRWVINMRSGEEIELLDQSSGKKWRKSSPAELLKILEEARCK